MENVVVDQTVVADQTVVEEDVKVGSLFDTINKLICRGFKGTTNRKC